MNNLQSTLFQNISTLLENARKRAIVAVNQTMVLTYFEIGRMIVEDEQKGENRAEYGKALLKDLSLHLTKKFGRGFSETNLRQMRNFYDLYSVQIQQTVSAEFEIIDKEKQQTLSAELQDAENQDTEKQKTHSLKSKKLEEPISSTLLTNLNNSENIQDSISETSSRKFIPSFNLSWSHYLKLMRIKDINERKFYEIESFKNNCESHKVAKSIAKGETK